MGQQVKVCSAQTSSLYLHFEIGTSLCRALRNGCSFVSILPFYRICLKRPQLVSLRGGKKEVPDFGFWMNCVENVRSLSSVEYFPDLLSSLILKKFCFFIFTLLALTSRSVTLSHLLTCYMKSPCKLATLNCLQTCHTCGNVIFQR